MSVTTAGAPSARASATGRPYPSSRDAVTNTARSASSAAYSGSVTPPWNTTEAPSGSGASASRASSSARRDGEMRESRWSVRPGRSRMARSRVSTFL